MVAISTGNKLQRALRAALLSLAIMAAFVSVLGQQRQDIALPFVDGEQLVYTAEFNRALLPGVDVGELRFSAKINPPAEAADKPVVTLVGDAVTKGLLIRLAGSRFH